MRDIELNAGVPLRGRRVLVLGAGGAAAGALDPLLAARPAALVVANRTPAKAQALIERFAASAARLDVPLSATSLEAPGAGFDVLINATAASLQGAVPPLPGGTLKPGALALDMMYGVATLPFLSWARAQGAIARDGLGMLVEQASEADSSVNDFTAPSKCVSTASTPTRLGAFSARMVNFSLPAAGGLPRTSFG